MNTALFYGFLLLLMLIGVALLYLSSKHQALLPQAIAVAPWRYLAYMLLLCSLCGWHIVLTPAAAFFWWLLVLSMMFGTLPLISLCKREPLK
ncbi:hypothetical protein [Shewanella sp.]|uniref:hypothetical protein n=1 Tax=Shewanella sp. TaxID=50422 RepID=UPI003A96B67E